MFAFTCNWCFFHLFIFSCVLCWFKREHSLLYSFTDDTIRHGSSPHGLETATYTELIILNNFSQLTQGWYSLPCDVSVDILFCGLSSSEASIKIALCVVAQPESKEVIRMAGSQRPGNQVVWSQAATGHWERAAGNQRIQVAEARNHGARGQKKVT